MIKRLIEIFDTTLREGAQTPYVNFTYKDKKLILEKLFRIGVGFAEVGYPASSNEELKEIQKITSLKKRPILSSLGRAEINDIQACNLAQTEIIDIDLGISSFQLDYLKLTLTEAYKKSFDSIITAKKTGKRIKFAAVDSYRTPLSHIVNLYKAVSKAGAEWFTLCDTVGITNPDEVSYSIRKLKKLGGCKISVHFHNDFNMATSNTIIAAMSGADQLELTINGIGDRAGIASLSPVVTYLKEIKGYDLNIDIAKLKSLSNFVSKITKIKISPLEPIIGDYCFKHSPSIHVAGVLKNPQNFEPINPHLLNQTRDIVLGRYSG